MPIQPFVVKSVNNHPVIASRFVWSTVGRIAVPIVCLSGLVSLAAHYAVYPERLWSDARIYFRATETWLAGGTPWAANVDGVAFGAPPPALLLNLPTLWLGESLAVMFWVLADAAAVVFLLRSFRLPLWWVGFYPITEGLAAASPDLVLAALILLGSGSVSALVKPYAVPAMLAAGRWRSVVLAGVAGLVTIPLLPWVKFLGSGDDLAREFAMHSTVVSALGNVPLMAVTAVALGLLGYRRGLALATPAMLAQQPHYAVFSLDTIARSRLLTLAMAIPVGHAAAFGVIIYAVVERIGLDRTSHDPGDAPAVGARAPIQ